MVSMAQLKPARQEGISHTATGGRTGQRARIARAKVLGWELRGQGGWGALRQVHQEEMRLEGTRQMLRVRVRLSEMRAMSLGV